MLSVESSEESAFFVVIIDAGHGLRAQTREQPSTRKRGRVHGSMLSRDAGRMWCVLWRKEIALGRDRGCRRPPLESGDWRVQAHAAGGQQAGDRTEIEDEREEKSEGGESAKARRHEKSKQKASIENNSPATVGTLGFVTRGAMSSCSKTMLGHMAALLLLICVSGGTNYGQKLQQTLGSTIVVRCAHPRAP